MLSHKMDFNCCANRDSFRKSSHKFMPFVYNHGIKELITHYRDSIHNREYHNFYYRDSIIFTIAQL